MDSQNIEIQALQSERYVATLKQDGKVWKILQIAFGQDGSLYIHFPYHKDSHGIASIVTLDASLTYPANNVSLTKQGKVTSHKIKFSHHPSGQVHFSQTGKIFTRIKRQGVPLRNIDGHIFTIMMQNPSWFEMVSKDEDKNHHSQRRTVFEFNMDGQPDEAYKFIGLWKPFDKFCKEIIPNPPTAKIIHPHIVLRTGATPRAGYVLNPPEGNPMHDYVLLLSIESIPRIAKDNNSIVFIGGFDPLDVVNNKKTETSFLALMYPSNNPTELMKSIGTIDIKS